MKETYYEVVAVAADGNTIPIGIKEINHKMELTIGATEYYTTNFVRGEGLFHHIATFFPIFKHLRLLEVVRDKEDSTNISYKILKEISL